MFNMKKYNQILEDLKKENEKLKEEAKQIDDQLSKTYDEESTLDLHINNIFLATDKIQSKIDFIKMDVRKLLKEWDNYDTQNDQN